MRKTLFLLAASTSLAACAATAVEVDERAESAAAEVQSPQIGSFGFDLTGVDRSIDPGDNFYRFANGHWADVTQIPADRSNYGMFTLLDDLSRERTRAILDEAQPGTRIGDFYASFMDEAAVNAAGITPIRSLLGEIRAIDSRAAWTTELGQLFRQGITGPFGGYVAADDRVPTDMIMRLTQSGLGLPDRDYYLRDEPTFVEKRNAYRDYLVRLLTLAGEANPEERAAAVIGLERQIAEVQWNRIDSRDDEKTYNKRSQSQLGVEAPGFDWPRFLGEIGLNGQQNVLVSQPSAFTGSARILSEAPLPVLKDYLLLRAMDEFAPYLSTDFVNANFAFHGTVLNGTPENEPRWKRGVSLVTSMVPDDISRIYVARHFPPEAKAAADRLVRNLIEAMDQRLANLTWMAPETRARARQKLASFTPKIGYPDHWRDYSSVSVSRGDLLQNVRNATEFEYRRQLAKIGQPVDRSEWFMTPMEINAYAYTSWNEVVFPAAILQPPFFDPNADAAINYGGIGAVIGHEISHHFDDQGSKYDQTGALNEWWTQQDRVRFNALTAQLVAQYDLYEPLPGQHVQGGLTLGENIADLAGLTVAYDAYRLSLGGRPAPTLDGFTGDQRFYLGWAQIWRRKYREANLLQRLLTDPHSPSEQRVAVVRNLEPWYGAYSVNADDSLYLPPERRVRIW